MSLKTISFTPFDVEIVHNGVPTGRYANRGVVRPTQDGMWSFQNTKPIYCIPGISFKFDIDEGITNTQTTAVKENFTYLLSKTHILWDFGLLISNKAASLSGLTIIISSIVLSIFISIYVGVF